MTEKSKVLPNDNEKEREGRNGRIYVSKRRTWIVIDANDNPIGEYRTKREALTIMTEKNQ